MTTTKVFSVVEIVSHIKDLSCPHCNSRLDEEKRWSLHTNGHWNESKKFECGLLLHFSPNFMKVKEESPCRQSDDYIKSRKRRTTLLDKIEELVAQSDADEEFKQKIRYWLPQGYHL